MIIKLQLCLAVGATADI